MYKLTGIQLVFKGTPNNADINDAPVYVDIPLNDNQFGSFSQQSDSADAKSPCDCSWDYVTGGAPNYFCGKCGQPMRR